MLPKKFEKNLMSIAFNIASQSDTQTKRGENGWNDDIFATDINGEDIKDAANVKYSTKVKSV